MLYEIQWNTIMSTLEGTLGATKSENQERLYIIVEIERILKDIEKDCKEKGYVSSFKQRE